MTITAQKHAWLNRISPKARQMVGLSVLEICAILSWTLLADTLFARVSGSWFILLPVAYLFAVALLAWLEQSGYSKGMLSPLKALDLAEITLNGRKPTQWQTLGRLFLTPPLTLLLGIGFLPVPGKKANLLQLASNSRIVPLDMNMDPRSRREIQESKQRVLMRVIAYTMTSLMVSAVIFLVPPIYSTSSGDGIDYSVSSLPDEERELLAIYLDLEAIYPDSIEFHVRLASLYYRNGMLDDLANELAHVRRLDPNHSILLLEQDLTVTIIDLQIQTDSSISDSIRIIMHQPDEPESDTLDSIAVDTVPEVPQVSRDTISLDLTVVSSESLQQEPDSVSFEVSDTLPDITPLFNQDSLDVEQPDTTLITPVTSETSSTDDTLEVVPPSDTIPVTAPPSDSGTTVTDGETNSMGSVSTETPPVPEDDQEGESDSMPDSDSEEEVPDPAPVEGESDEDTSPPEGA